MAEDQAFFDQRPQRGVRRDTLVLEISQEETAQITKMASSVMCQALCEGILGALVLTIIIQDEQPSQVQAYLEWWLIVNGSFGVLKVAMFALCARRRRLQKSQLQQIAVQFLQGFSNLILFIVSYTAWDNIQYWFWEKNPERDFYATMTAVCLGLIEYFYLFLMACYAILGFIFIIVWSCSECNRRYRANELNGQSSQQRQETSQNLGQLSRLFDYSKFSEHEECVICLMPFTAEDMVTPLPCDKRHYFHSNCIEEWSQNHNDCPLCKKTFNAQDLAEALNRRSFVEPSGGTPANDAEQYMVVNESQNAPLIQDA